MLNVLRVRTYEMDNHGAMEYSRSTEDDAGAMVAEAPRISLQAPWDFPGEHYDKIKVTLNYPYPLPGEAIEKLLAVIAEDGKLVMHIPLEAALQCAHFNLYDIVRAMHEHGFTADTVQSVVEFGYGFRILFRKGFLGQLVPVPEEFMSLKEQREDLDFGYRLHQIRGAR